MRSFLSIDLDFWTDLPQEQMIKFLEKVFKLNTKKDFFVYHHHMLKQINLEEFDTLYNIDYHSDLCDGLKPPLNEGTWVNFVKHKNQRNFIWIYPNKDCYSVKGRLDGCEGHGRCDVDQNPFKNSLQVCGWKKTTHRKSLPTIKELKDVTAIGICSSPDWTPKSKMKYVMKYLYKNNLITKKYMETSIYKSLNQKD